MMNNTGLCATCGTQYAPNSRLPEFCPICEDDRQYIPPGGQLWASMDTLQEKYTVNITSLDASLYCLKVQPDFALANRALLVNTPGGNILWDCIPLLDDRTVKFVNDRGGLKAIAISHPHYYTAMNEWAQEFDCPVYIHSADSEWPVYQTDHIRFWEGNEFPLWDGIRIVHTGGHFPGSSILHIPGLSEDGTVLCGDSLYVSRSRKHLAVMYSYPNQILLSKEEFKIFLGNVAELKFDTVYGAFDNQEIKGNAMQIFLKSMLQYRESYGLETS
jgi:glyoxylase-like metal-dependent hydrolase (beta-lactamase superfamily II)